MADSAWLIAREVREYKDYTHGPGEHVYSERVVELESGNRVIEYRSGGVWCSANISRSLGARVKVCADVMDVGSAECVWAMLERLCGRLRGGEA